MSKQASSRTRNTSAVKKPGKEGMTYKKSGVDYSKVDPQKVKALQEMEKTHRWTDRFGFEIVPWTIGESVVLIRTPLGHLAFVVEGLGTKSLVADAMINAVDPATGLNKHFYKSIAQCNLAMAINDLITLGAFPLAYGQYLGLGSSDWLKNKKRADDLVVGTAEACGEARCAWVGGETPVLSGIINAETADLAGAAIGFIPKKYKPINPANIRDGDRIILLESSGIHANGLTMARKIAEKLPRKYRTKLSDGRSYGEALLDPTVIYASFVEECMRCRVDFSYLVNITGHGFRKLMRAKQPFTYVIEDLPVPQPVFKFMQNHGKITDEEMYRTFNMGAGFAAFVREKDTERVCDIARVNGYNAEVSGYIESGTKRVVLEPINVTYEADSLAIRA